MVDARKMRPKDFDIYSIMKRIGRHYLPESAVYQKVEKALQKLSMDELDSLDTMISTVTVPEPVQKS
jgi:hypothetical protein